MAEEKPSLHIDTDWKKQAQEEKRKLAEEEARKKQAAQPAQGAGAAAAAGAGAPTGAKGRPARGELPPASMATLIQSTMTQALFHLGDIAVRGEQPAVNLEMSKHYIDTLSVLEEKTKGNLSEEEKEFLDTSLYQARMRYVAVASQFLGP